MSFSRAGLDPARQPRPLRSAAETHNLRGCGMMVSQEAETKLDHRSKRAHPASLSATQTDHLGSGSNMVPSETPKVIQHRAHVNSLHADAYKDHIAIGGDEGMVTRPSARLKRAPGAYKKRNPNIQSAFAESKVVNDQPKYRRPQTATPWAHDMPSARGGANKKVYPKTAAVPRRKLINEHPAESVTGGKAAGGSAPTHASNADNIHPGTAPAHQGKKHMGTHANDESKPIDPPPPRAKDKPIPGKYRSTPNLLRFSPRMSSMTPRKMVAGQKAAPVRKPTQSTGFLSWPEKSNSGGELADAKNAVATATSGTSNPDMPTAGVKRGGSPKKRKIVSRPMTEDPISGMSPVTYQKSGLSQVEFERRQSGYGGVGAFAGCDDKRVRTKKPASNSFLSSSHVFSTSGTYGASPPNAKTDEKRCTKRILAATAPPSSQPSFAGETASQKGKRRDHGGAGAGGASGAAAGGGGGRSGAAASSSYSGGGGPIWAHQGYTRSPFDPGSARGVKPHAASTLPPRRHVDPSGKIN